MFQRAAGFTLASLVAIALVVAQARHDSADPMRCAGLLPLGNRCCAVDQVLQGGLCRGRPAHCPDPLEITEQGCAAVARRVLVTAGTIHAGAGDWEAEGRVVPGERAVSAFALDAFEITERDYLACVVAQACPGLPLSGEPGRALGGVTREEAAAYCRFRGARLPSSDEWTLAAAGARSRRYPWGDTGAVCRRGAWGLRDGPCGFGFEAPEVSGGHPDGATPEGVHDLAGNVSEWVADDHAGLGEVRGGSYAATLATDLRTWKADTRAAGNRSPGVGARCAYDVDAAAAPLLPVLASPVP